MAMFNKKIMNDNKTMKLELRLIFFVGGKFLPLGDKNKIQCDSCKKLL
jgi:hypothetical protein